MYNFIKIRKLERHPFSPFLLNTRLERPLLGFITTMKVCGLEFKENSKARCLWRSEIGLINTTN